jgi:ribonuclease-3 family protein
LTSSPPEDNPGSPHPEARPSFWLTSLPTLAPEADLNILQLAWLGDAVWELHQRLQKCHSPGRPGDLHNQVVAKVRAEAQATALERLKPHLRAGEQSLVRRGRNRAGRGSRQQDGSLQGQATGFETMVGWLFLKDPRRLAELLDHLEEPDTTPLPTDHGPISE